MSVNNSWILNIDQNFSAKYYVTYLNDNKIIDLTLSICDTKEIITRKEYSIDINHSHPHKIGKIDDSKKYVVIDTHGKLYMMIWSYKSIKKSFYYRVEHIDCCDHLFSDFRFSSKNPYPIYLQTTDDAIIKFDMNSKKFKVITTSGSGTFSLKKNNTKSSESATDYLC